MEQYLKDKYSFFSNTEKVFHISMVAGEVLINVEKLKVYIRKYINPRGQRLQWDMTKESFIALIILILNTTTEGL